MKINLLLMLFLALMQACSKHNESASFFAEKVQQDQLPLLSEGGEITVKRVLENSIKMGKVEEVAMLILTGKISMFELSTTGDSLPLYALKLGQTTIAQFFLKEGHNGDFVDSKNNFRTIPMFILDQYLGELNKVDEKKLKADLELFGLYTRIRPNLKDAVYSDNYQAEEIILKYAIEADLNLAKSGIMSGFTYILAENGLKINLYQGEQSDFARSLEESSEVVNKYLLKFANLQNYKVFNQENIRVRKNTNQASALTENQRNTFIGLLQAFDKMGFDLKGEQGNDPLMGQMLAALDPEVFGAIIYTMRKNTNFSFYKNLKDPDNAATVIEDFILQQTHSCDIASVNSVRNQDDCYNDYIANLGILIHFMIEDHGDAIASTKVKELANFIPDQGYILDLFARQKMVSPQLFVMLLVLGADLDQWLDMDTDLKRREKRQFLRKLSKVEKNLSLLIKDQKRKIENRKIKTNIDLFKLLTQEPDPNRRPIFIESI